MKPARVREKLVKDITAHFEDASNYAAAGVPPDFKFTTSTFFILANEINRGCWKIGERLPESALKYFNKNAAPEKKKSSIQPTPPLTPPSPPFAGSPWQAPWPFLPPSAVASPAADQNAVLISVLRHVKDMQEFSEVERIKLCVKLTKVTPTELVNVNSVITLTQNAPLMATVLTQVLRALI